ncbi:RloB family protein [Clostridium tyrobutyricum]|uniref:RloB family protein n=1 Tax=Clostridium tyrobutyricum TaxID=1519 RepID=UPI0011CC781B|nr:RloB family protein [Clostridium tyrobutyricum]
MKNRGGRKRQRKVNTRIAAPGNYLIITEGTETEVNYFKSIKSRIEELFRSKIIVEKISLKIEGTGRSTMVLVNEAIKKRSLGIYSDVWVVFDKDDNSDFDDAITYARRNGINAAWSNQCFELWLLLHFQDFKADVDRSIYYDKLDNHFKTRSINNGKYDKNISDIFNITFPFIDKAIKRSNNLFSEYREHNIFEPSKMNPCTTVQCLVEELIKYIK